MDKAVRALLLTDVVDSTQLVESLGEERAAEVWAAHDTAARELLPSHHGLEIDKTDGFLMLFESAADAAAYALEYHRALKRLSEELGVDLQARAGIHAATVILRRNPADEVALGAKPLEVEGLAKPLAARVMSLARGRQTLLTGSARGQLGDELPGEAKLESQGHWRLKGVTDPVTLFEIGIEGEAPFTPPPDAEKAYRVVRVEERWEPSREIPHSLPVERDAFVGREEDMAGIATRFDGGARLVTVLGTGGAGKTRMVTRYARTWLGDHPGGAWFCDLSETRSEDGLAHAVATTLQVSLSRDPIAQLGHAIAARGRCLIILDNFEQVVEHAEATVGAWLKRAPEASFLVTSRERLHVAGEELLPLEPLPVEGAALELFVRRARAQKKEFTLTDENRAAVEEVVRLLDGLPLAIELAAARVRVLAPTQLLERMKDRFKLLAGARGAKQRQATLRAAIDWSWDLLEPWEQSAFAQTSVFEGGFTLEAAEDVLDLSAFPDAPSPLDAVQSLLDKSLLRSWTPPRGDERFEIDEAWFGMYVSIHEYASEKLRTEGAIAASASGQEAEQAAFTRHGRHFAEFGTEESLDGVNGPEGRELVAARALALENLVAGSARGVARGDGSTATLCLRAAWPVISLRGPMAIGARLAEPVLAMKTLSPLDRERALLVKAASLLRAGRTAEGVDCVEPALSSAREREDPRLEAEVLRCLAIGQANLGDNDAARETLEAALAIHRSRGDRVQEGTALSGLGSVYREQGALVEARRLYDESQRVLSEVGDLGVQAVVLINIGILRRLEGDLDGARRAYDEALARYRESGDSRHQCLLLNNLANLVREQGENELAVECFSEALALARQLGERLLEGAIEGNLGTLQADCGERVEGRRHLEQACAINAECRSPGFEAEAWAGLGALHATEGRPDESRAAFERAETLLRDIGDELYLGVTLCHHAKAELLGSQREAAHAALAAAELLAAKLEAQPDSMLGKALAAARAAVQAGG